MAQAQGVCYIPELNIGSALIKDAMGYDWEQQWQYRFMNVPVDKYSEIILGLQFITTFDYVLFDNVNQEVIFSKEGAFVTDNPDLWQSFPFSIKPDSIRNERIMVQMPINGQEYELFFDSCGSAPGLDLSKSDWQTIKPDLTVKQLRNTHRYSYQYGRFSCQEATVSELTIGEKTLKDVEIVIREDPKKLSMLSLGYFQDTVVVLDFVNNLMWIKNKG